MRNLGALRDPGEVNHSLTMSYPSFCLNIREAFFKSLNLSDYRDYYSTTYHLALEFLTAATIPPPFVFSVEIFEQWLDREYQAGLDKMRKHHWLDSGMLMDGRQVGRFSDRAVRERLLQYAPYNMLDGHFLSRIMPCGSASVVEMRLFQIFWEETGSGSIHDNHPALYTQLLTSQGIKLPSVYSWEFSQDSRFINEAFDQPVFQLCVGLHPRHFLPELLGMTLFLEWNATPASCRCARNLRSRGIDDTFFKVHQVADNPVRGHASLVKEAVELYLQDVEAQGGDIDHYWQRIWRGYHTWSSLDDAFEQTLQDYMVEFDGKS